MMVGLYFAEQRVRIRNECSCHDVSLIASSIVAISYFPITGFNLSLNFFFFPLIFLKFCLAVGAVAPLTMSFVRPMSNVTVFAGREAVFTCVVDDVIGAFKVN